MRGPGVSKRLTGEALIRRYAVLSLVIISVITAVLSLTITSALRKDLLDREWGITADFIRAEAFQTLSAADFERPETVPAQERLEDFHHRTLRMPEIISVRVYDATPAVIWSDQRGLIGQRVGGNAHLVASLTGRTVANLARVEEKPGLYHGPIDSGTIVELYVPIMFPGTGRVVGVVETFKAPGQVFANIRRGRLMVVSTALAGGLLLYLSLFWIVRRAARRIDEQHQALERHGRDLASANEDLRGVQAQLLEAERLAGIGEVVTAVAHGIRNPLANIRASAQVAALGCRDGGMSPLTQKNLVNIMAEVDRLEARLKELLQFVRPAERSMEPLDLNAVLLASLDQMAARIGKSRIVTQKILSESLPPILGNALFLEQVFLSLLGNAVEALPGGEGTITLATGTSFENGVPAAVFAEIRDTGVGIAPEDIAKVFRPFHTTKAQGTGLGLAIAKKFTEVQGGTIAVESRPGRGTTFRVAFPAFRKG